MPSKESTVRDLHLCPFCGGVADIYRDPGQPGYEPFYVVYCTRCEARGPEKEKREDAIAGWNRRSTRERG